jgi:hypothetical protein
MLARIVQSAMGSIEGERVLQEINVISLTVVHLVMARCYVSVDLFS